jgi:transcriptional regulator with GAF, ATPase, and Fis domain
MNEPVSSDSSERSQLARLEALDELLPTLAGVLDVREVFERVSAIARRVLPHDTMSLPLITEDKNHLLIYAIAGPEVFPQQVPLPEHHRALATMPWDHIIHPDIQADPLERETPPGLAGYRARLVVPIRVQGEFLGGMDFLSHQPNVYTTADVMIARRIADHVALALSHQRLAEESRRAAALREQATKLELLDASLAALIDTGVLRDVIDRISHVAQKVLAHDAMVVPLLMPDGAHVRFHITQAPDAAKFPEVIEIPEYLRRFDWEYDIVDDFQVDPQRYGQRAAELGYRSALRIPIRVEGQFAAGVAFFSFTPSFYTKADVIVGRRVADRLALSLSREHAYESAKRADEAVERAARLERKVAALTDELNSRAGFSRVVGKSASFRQVLTRATQVAATETTVLLLGESGTGKEVVARFLHRASARSGGPFVALNCAALPETLLESELFGYERGAFTGAMQAKPGQIEQASGGVLFLDEVGEMSPSAQAKFLRVLQEREFQRLGGTRVMRANVRVVAATNKNLRAAMEAGTFREDLYYRLQVFEIQMPPLRERKEDILLLSDAFLHDIAASFGRPPAGISSEARDALLAYDWPGNVRELRNMLERAAILCDGGLITGEHLNIFASRAPGKMAAPKPPAGATAAPDTTDLRTLERSAIQRALETARFNKSLAAKALGLTRKQLYIRLRQHGIE